MDRFQKCMSIIFIILIISMAMVIIYDAKTITSTINEHVVITRTWTSQWMLGTGFRFLTNSSILGNYEFKSNFPLKEGEKITLIFHEYTKIITGEITLVYTGEFLIDWK